MTQGLTNPITGKTYTYKGFTPQRRISDSCGYNSHITCSLSPQKLITKFDFEFTKATCCLCPCHFEREVQ